MSIVTRRQMLSLGSAAVGGIAAGALCAPTPAVAGLEPETAPFSWTPRALDPKETAPIAHDRFYHQGFGCGYGVFYSTIGLMGEKFGDPYKNFPFSMMEMGKSGFSDWGTLCGALVGAVAAMSMFWGRKDRDAMVTELFRWYELTAFPMYLPPADAKIGKAGPLPSSVSGSVLCHISVSTWCKASGFAADSPERSERCSRVTADVSAKAVEIMNAKINKTFAGTASISKEQARCIVPGCHGNKAEKFASPVLKSKMDCVPCHSGSKATMDKLVTVKTKAAQAGGKVVSPHIYK